MTPTQLSRALCTDPKLKKLRMALINMDILFKSYLSFTSDNWIWGKKVRFTKNFKKEFIEVTYYVNNGVKMRYEIKINSKSPHKNYMIDYLENLDQQDQLMTYTELRDYFKKEIVHHFVKHR